VYDQQWFQLTNTNRPFGLTIKFIQCIAAVKRREY
jgi:hypothetical protein